MLHKYISWAEPVPQPLSLTLCLYSFRWNRSPVGDEGLFPPDCPVQSPPQPMQSTVCAAHTPVCGCSVSLLSPRLFLSEGVGSRNTSDQLVINEAHYFSFKKLWRDSHKARTWPPFQKPGCRKNPFEITLLLPGLLLLTLWQEATASESVNLLSLLGQELPWYKFIAVNRAGPLIPSAYL